MDAAETTKAQPAIIRLGLPAEDSSTPRPLRHRWVKVQTHLYRCRRGDCQLRKLNVGLAAASTGLGGTTGKGGWTVRWTWPDGTVHPGTHTPPCRGGDLT